jgi:biopolymer transport protein ExbD
MAQMQENDKGDGKKKGKQKKIQIHVDFTPMVDMNMLLICFFMLATTMSKPQTMEIVMPAKNTQVKEENKTEAPADRLVTVLLDGSNKLYYYEGDPTKINPETDYDILNETSYDADGFRAYLIKRNTNVVKQLREFKNNRDSIQANTKNLQKQLTELKEHAVNLISQNRKSGIDDNLRIRLDSILITSIDSGRGSLMDGYKKYVSEIKKSDNASPIIVIKATDAATYENLIDILDEMQICGIASYAVSEITREDKFLILNFETKGEAAKAAAP